MMPSPRRIGLDIGFVRVKAAQVNRLGKITRLASFPRLNPYAGVGKQEAEYIASVLLRQGFDPGPIVLAGNDDQVRIEELELPPISDRSASDKIVASEIARITHWAPGAFEHAWWTVPPRSPRAATNCALAVACTHANADALIEPLETAGFEIDAIDVKPVAVSRACSQHIQPDGLTCVLDIGWLSSVLSASLGSTLVFVRSLPASGLNQLASQLRAPEHCKPQIIDLLNRSTERTPWGTGQLRRDYLASTGRLEKTLASELGRSFAYLTRRFSGTNLNGCLMTGGGAATPGLINSVDSTLGLTMSTATPASLGLINPRSSRWANDPTLVAAAGLAMWKGGAA